MRRALAKFVIFVALAALPAVAQQSRVFRQGDSWVEEITGSLPAVRNLRLSTDAGAVRVQGGNQNSINYVIRKRINASSEQAARRRFETFKVSVGTEGDTASIEGEAPEGGVHRLSVDFSLDVPRNLDWAKLETQGGSMVVASIAGRVDASTGGGSMKLEQIAGNITGETGGGSIAVDAAGADLKLETGGGSIHIGSVKGKIEAQTGGGSVEVGDGMQGALLETGGGSIAVRRCLGKVKASTGGGSIELGQIDGPAELETGGGSIRVAGAKRAVKAESGGGSIELFKLGSGARVETGGGAIIAEFIASRGNFTESSLETPSGDITVYLLPEIALTLHAAIEMASGHNIRSDFPQFKVTIEGEEYGPKRVMAYGSLNGGGPVLKVETNSGDISLLRAGR